MKQYVITFSKIDLFNSHRDFYTKYFLLNFCHLWIFLTPVIEAVKIIPKIIACDFGFQKYIGENTEEANLV